MGAQYEIISLTNIVCHQFLEAIYGILNRYGFAKFAPDRTQSIAYFTDRNLGLDTVEYPWQQVFGTAGRIGEFFEREGRRLGIAT